MKPRFISYVAALALLVSLIAASAASPASAGSGTTRRIALAGTGSLVAGGPSSSDGTLDQDLEFPEKEEEAGTPDAFTGTIDRSLSKGSGSGIVTATAKKAKSNPQVEKTFEGLNHYQQRYARGGNQFSVEPPDQGLCVGGGYVVEAVNDVVNIFNYSGQSVLPDNTSTNIVSGSPRNVNHAVDLNSFYGYAAAVNRTPGAVNPRGPFVTDPSCYYDAATQRFFMVVLTLEVNPANGAFTTVNHLDLAVTTTSNPTGLWKIYRIDATNDGTNTGGTNPGPYLGDYPHIGADANGLYITTNAYPWCCNGFSGAQLYALSKAQLVAGAATVTMQHIDTSGMVNAPSDAGPTQPGFTVWPAQSPGTSSFELGAGGTEYFLSSNAADEATHPKAGTGGDYTSSKIVLWALTNTSSLNSATPSVNLSNTLLSVATYALPPKASQPGSGTAPGLNAPQGRCINDTTTVLFNGQTGCWRLLFGSEPAHNEVISKLDSNDTRMQQVMYANGKVWGALDTAVTFGATNQAGVGWYIVKPEVSSGSVTGKIALTGNTGVEGKDIVYPAIGVTASGRGVVALTIVGTGATDFPSAAYASIDAKAGMGEVHIVAPGAAPDDGFTSYRAQSSNPANTPRTRWGDYGAAAVDGNSIWIASEYIAQACDYTRWGGPSFAGGTGDNLLGTCGGVSRGPGARSALGNWSTAISKLTP